MTKDEELRRDHIDQQVERRDEANKREQGYYWVIFPYAWHGVRKPEHWEVASWDAEKKMWALIGSGQPWHDFQIKDVGPKVELPSLIELTKEMKKK